MADRVPMTVEGEKKLRAKLEALKSQRPEITQAIAEARAHGDLKENAEYHAAKERQGLVEGEISKIEGELSRAQVIDVTKIRPNGRVVFGTTVQVVNQDTEEEFTYQIVGDSEAEIKAGKISVNSPMARAFIGKEEGDEVVVKTPSGEIYYEIVQIDYV